MFCFLSDKKFRVHQSNQFIFVVFRFFLRDGLIILHFLLSLTKDNKLNPFYEIEITSGNSALDSAYCFSRISRYSSFIATFSKNPAKESPSCFSAEDFANCPE